MQNVEDILPLSPMQELMLLHLAAAGARGSTALIEQSVVSLQGDLDPAALRQAWQQVVDRHQALRAAFAWQGMTKPVQVIRRKVTLPWEEVDWRHLEESARKVELDARLDADRRRGFDPLQAPLMRLALIRVGQDTWWMLKSAHHIVFDRWSVGVMLREVLTLYADIRSGRRSSLPPAPPYKAYFEHLARQDPRRAEAYWRESLAGLPPDAATLPVEPDAVALNGSDPFSHERVGIGGIADFSRGLRITASTLFQGLLGLAIARVTGRSDVVIGLTVSSRPAEVAGAEQMVGMFSNNLPFRVRLRRAQKVRDWLCDLQRQQEALREFQHTPLTSVREWGGFSDDRPLFECLLVFQNDPASEGVADASATVGLAIGGIGGHSRTSYPLTVMGVPSGDGLDAALVHDRRRLSGDWVRRLSREIEQAARRIVENPEAVLGELLSPVEAAPSGETSMANRFLAAAAARRRGANAVTSAPAKPEVPAAAAGVTAPAPAHAAGPSSATERLIAGVWRDLLRVEQVNAHDNFFDIGGTSILAVQAAQRLKHQLRVTVNPMDLAMQTLSQLAAACAARAARAER